MAVLRFTIASVVLAICFIQNGSARIYEPVNAENSSDVEISIGGINEFMAMYPDANIEQLQMQSKVRGRMNYTLGSRLSGDTLVAQGAKNQNWNVPQNVNITLSYPGQGVGAQLTYIAIQVDQTTNLGQAYVVRGGLHQRYITIVVEGYNVLYMNYNAQFYGVR